MFTFIKEIINRENFDVFITKSFEKDVKLFSKKRLITLSLIIKGSAGHYKDKIAHLRLKIQVMVSDTITGTYMNLKVYTNPYTIS